MVTREINVPDTFSSSLSLGIMTTDQPGDTKLGKEQSMGVQAKACVWGIFIVLTCWVSMASGEVVNYENDPVLAKAMEYDREMNGGDANKADRAMAEKYYLEYLERKEVPSFQRAHIYTQLGVLYTTASNRKRGEEPDYAMATGYFRKALEAEPVRLGYSTIRARGMMRAAANHVRFPPNRSDPVRASTAAIESSIEGYTFLGTVDANAIRENWLPRKPGDVPLPSEIASLTELARGLEHIICENVKGFALPVPSSELEPVLRGIIDRLPGTDLAASATEILRERGLEPPAPRAAELPATTTTTKPVVNDSNGPAVREVVQANPAAEASVSSGADGGNGGSGSLYLWVGAGALLVVVVGGVLAKMAASHR